LGSQMPLPQCVCVCVCVCALLCLGDDCQQAVPLRERREGGRCFQRGPSLLPKGGGDLLSHPVKVSHWCSDTRTHTHTHTHTHMQTYTQPHTRAHTLRHTANSQQETLNHNAKAPQSRRVHCSNQVGYGAALIVR